ncbi:unnamed protein product [Rotaria sp. Silwood2]|nr:unnamed protein product [Rotaria sp. Silwood2]CAF4259935.1 unnamed protein product [Rotaria sp. Silwood2]
MLQHSVGLHINEVKSNKSITISKKKLPDGKEKTFSLSAIEQCRHVVEIIQNLEEQSGETVKVKKSINTAHRIVGKGEYIMQNKDQYHTIFRYVLKSSSNMGNTQEFFNISKEDSFVIFVKNSKMNISFTTDLTSTEEIEFPEETKKCLVHFNDHQVCMQSFYQVDYEMEEEEESHSK